MEKEEMERIGQTREETMEEERLQTQVHDKQGGILRLHKMRVTSLPTNKEIILPDERPEREEAGLRAFGTKMIEVAQKNTFRKTLTNQEIQGKEISQQHKKLA